jgi:hypothetical protein
MSKAKPQLKLDVCYLCNKTIKPTDEVHLHHIIPYSEGGEIIEPVYYDCHIDEHSNSGDFSKWGRIGGIKQSESPKASWPMNLKNMRFCPKVDPHFQ